MFSWDCAFSDTDDLEGALRAHDGMRGAAQNVEVEPDRPISHVDRVVKFLITKIAMAAVENLP